MSVKMQLLLFVAACGWLRLLLHIKLTHPICYHTAQTQSTQELE
jgi:hypothetical protein